MKVLLTYEDRLDNLLLTEWWVLLSYLILSLLLLPRPGAGHSVQSSSYAFQRGSKGSW